MPIGVKRNRKIGKCHEMKINRSNFIGENDIISGNRFAV